MSDTPRSPLWTALRACRLWRTASDEAIDALAEKASARTVSRGALLASEGDSSDTFMVVMSGKVQVVNQMADGRRLTLETFESGDPVAAVASLAGTRTPFNVEAATDATIATLPRAALFELLAHEPEVAAGLIADLAARVIHFTAVVQGLSMSVPARLARYLFQRSLSAGRPTQRGLEFDLGMAKSELATALGTVPETLSRAFAKLRDEEVADVHGQNVIVLDVRALASLGSGYDD